MSTDNSVTQGCNPEELRTLFLFEKLTDEQLDRLCREGHVETVESGQVFAEGDPASCLYVLIDGAVVNGSAGLVGWIAGVTRHLQSGFLYSYAFWMIIGLAVMLGWLLTHV